MNIYKRIINRLDKIAVVGLGYVGMPIAVSFSKKIKVIGFDTNQKKIDLYKSGIDPTNEVGDENIKNSTVEFTSDESKLKEALFYIVAVPTPINLDKTPDLEPVENASRVIGRNLRIGSIIVYESTVYPGVTEDICIRILEEESGLKCGTDFKVGYSPERINPGDKVHRLENIVKIVSGIDDECLEEIAKVYEIIIEAGVHRVSSIKVAEAAKVVENSQRDINIAFMNELAMVFDRMGINTNEVLDAMNTKWNALKFTPGLVGGHCIGVDPYYFIYEAEKLGYHSQIILSGRKINDDIPNFIVSKILKKLILSGVKIKGSNILILGITFKENTPDLRNSKVLNIINGLKEYGVNVYISDDNVNCNEAFEVFGQELVKHNEIKQVDCIVVAVGHEYIRNLDFDFFRSKYNDNSECVFIDIKGIFSKHRRFKEEFKYWSL